NIDLSYNLLTTIPEDLFNNSENLTSVNLKRNQIKNVTKCFSGNNRLEHIDLSNNLIGFCDYAFQSLLSLKTINLEDNRVRKITKNCFSSTPSLEELILRQNNISQIDSEAFSQLDQLQNIDVSRNRLKTLSRESFPVVLKIRELFTS
ncbi:leucine-rich repeat and immunoglobulin-like domain-containing nogo receptor-interacting protein 2, partial [Parasteatoda tepidariorum]|uniref:leucine-rich repeat and immunoglobulin-like domain-containing nogo receptor-interacting protein 2 n=1 Tax=Parasteatoda tepidariorum TaxID=114398 RepID=UPI0039BD8B25